MKLRKYLCLGLVVWLSLGVVACGKKDTTVQSIDDIAASVLTQPAKEQATTSGYKSDVGLVEKTTEYQEPTTKAPEPTKAPTYITPYCNVTGNTSVPQTNMDGSSCSAFFSSIDASDFTLGFGSKLTDEDLREKENYYLVGTEQIKTGDLLSTGWLISNLSNLSDSDIIYFTNLHVIGKFNTSSTIMLCSYDWYSAYGMRDTLVLFEDISGTLSSSSFNDGDIVSTVIIAKNIRVETVNGKNIVHIEYATK